MLVEGDAKVLRRYAGLTGFRHAPKTCIRRVSRPASPILSKPSVP